MKLGSPREHVAPRRGGEVRGGEVRGGEVSEVSEEEDEEEEEEEGERLSLYIGQHIKVLLFLTLKFIRSHLCCRRYFSKKINATTSFLS